MSPDLRTTTERVVGRRAALAALAAAVAVVAALGTAVATPTPTASAGRPTHLAASTVWRTDFTGPRGAPLPGVDWIAVTGHRYPGGPPNWGNGELQDYVASGDSLHLDGQGHLSITATVDRGEYRSARIETRRSDLVPPPDGTLRLQARIELPAARGSWATFWTLGRSFREDLRWPESGEVDVVEYRGSHPDEAVGVLHCPQCDEPRGRNTHHRAPVDLHDAFHTFTVDWRRGPEELDWYIDGRRYQSVTGESLGAGRRVLDQPVFLLLSLAVGGDFAGPPDADDYPTTMSVDYVEVRSCLGSCPPLAPD